MATGDPSAVLLQYGAIGAIDVILGFFAWRAYKRESDRADRLELQLAEANQRIVEANQRIADRFSEVLAQTSDVLAQTRDDVRDRNDYLRDLARRRA